MVAQQVSGDAEEIAAGGDVALAGKACAEKADVALLHEVVGEGWVAGGAGEVGPERARGPLVEVRELLAVHAAAGATAGERLRFARQQFGMIDSQGMGLCFLRLAVALGTGDSLAGLRNRGIEWRLDV